MHLLSLPRALSFHFDVFLRVFISIFLYVIELPKKQQNSPILTHNL